jgi:hypothetical protein
MSDPVVDVAELSHSAATEVRIDGLELLAKKHSGCVT